MSKLNINFNDKNYEVSNSALSSPRADFVAHLGTIAGEGLKLVVDGVEYSVDPTKLDGAVVSLETVLNNLNGGSDTPSEPLAPGLYQTGTSTLISSWDELVASDVITVKNGACTKGSSADSLVGDLVISDDESITSIGNNAFNGCTGLTSVTIGNSVTSISGNAFINCYNLARITIPNSVTKIGSYAFFYCYNLTSITIPESMTQISIPAFDECGKLVEVINKSSLNILIGSQEHGGVARWAKEVHSGTSKIVNQNNYLFYTYDGVNYLLGYVGTDTELTLPESYNGHSYEIYDYAFRSCSKLTSIVIPDGVTYIGEYAFTTCTGLTNVTIGNSVVQIDDYAFRGCTGLTSVTIPSSVTRIGKVALGVCSNLTEVNFEGTCSQWRQIAKGSDWNYNIPATYVQCTDGQVAL